MTIAIAV